MDTRRLIVLQAMLHDLKSNRLTVIKLPSRYDGYIRIPVTVNCEWYRNFCSSFTRYRKKRDRTIIKRCHTINALNRLIAGKTTPVYTSRLEEFIMQYDTHFDNQPNDIDYDYSDGDF